MKIEVKEIQISEIVGSLCKMRLEEDYEKEELMASIAKYGVMNPIKVKRGKNGYMVFAGHRRLEYSRELGLLTIPAEIWEDISDEEAVLMGFIDNINRKDFSQLEEATAYTRLIEEFDYSVADLVESCGKSQSRIYTLFTVAHNLPEEMKAAIINGKMTFGHGEWLLKIEDPKLREKLFQKVLDGEVDVGDLKYQVHRQKPDSEKDYDELQLDLIEDICEKDPDIQAIWKKSVNIRRSRHGLKITVEVCSMSDCRKKFHTILKPLEEEGE
jgi:ParB family transcriptional regulator, chromosome partitioning protein